VAIEVLFRWLGLGFWAGWAVLPVIAVARSAVDLLVLLGWCLVAGAAGVVFLWVATLGLRRLGDRDGGRSRHAPAGSRPVSPRSR
jgi:hypothetical protein